jgi:predicted RNase H-like nuclease (RuvC/YqgF family)
MGFGGPFGGGFGFGGFGAPVIVAPAPTLGQVVAGAAIEGAVSGAVHNSMRGPSSTDRMLDNQIRQDERQMDKQSAEIEALQKQIEELKAQKR